MNTSQLSSYTAQVASSSQTQVIKVIQETLLAQSSLFDSGLVNLSQSEPLDELQGLLDVWSEEASDLNSLDISIVVEISKVDANVSSAGEVIASASEVIRSISVDWDSYDCLRMLSNAINIDRLEIPITIEQETRRSIGDITLVSHQILNTVISGKKENVTKAITVLEEKGSTPEKLDASDIQILFFCIDPQKIKLNLEYCILVINEFEIQFRESSEQMVLLRIMFGGRGKNHKRITFSDIHRLLREQGHPEHKWIWREKKYDKNDPETAKKKAKFIKQCRNTASNINAKISRKIGLAGNFLETKDKECRINPEFLISKKS